MRLSGASLSFVVALVLAAYAAGMRAEAMGTARVFGPAQGGNFTVGCGFSHRAPDDPIVLPGQPGSSHDHSFLGNRTTDAFSTEETLLSGGTTCDRKSDRSAYWVPTLLRNGKPVRPLGAAVYYRRRTYAPVIPFPLGLRMVAGNASAEAPQGVDRIWWNCQGDAPKLAEAPVCTPRGHLRLHVEFPECWDGERLDSDDQSHVVYADEGVCPETHSYALPSLMLVVGYPVRGNEMLSFSSGGLDSAHADAMLAWRDGAQEVLVERCLDERRKCGRNSHGRAECPVTIEESMIPPSSLGPACVSEISLSSLRCRLEVLHARTEVATELGQRRASFVRAIEWGQRQLAEAADRCADRPGIARTRVHATARRLRGYARYLRAHPLRCRLPARVRADLAMRVEQLRIDLLDVTCDQP